MFKKLDAIAERAPDACGVSFECSRPGRVVVGEQDRPRQHGQLPDGHRAEGLLAGRLGARWSLVRQIARPFAQQGAAIPTGGGDPTLVIDYAITRIGRAAPRPGTG
jgi:hypothetical protein